LRADTGIFISYRRADNPYPVEWLYQHLAEHFGREHVFKDVDTLDPGDDFTAVITAALSSCAALIAVIGRQWLACTDDRGHRRLDDPEDFVRLEIETALNRGVRVIPVLVDRATLPKPEDLPPGLQALTGRQCLELDPLRFDAGTRQLIRVLDKTIAAVTAAAGNAIEPTTGDAEQPTNTATTEGTSLDRAAGAADADVDARPDAVRQLPAEAAPTADTGVLPEDADGGVERPNRRDLTTEHSDAEDAESRLPSRRETVTAEWVLFGQRQMNGPYLVLGRSIGYFDRSDLEIMMRQYGPHPRGDLPQVTIMPVTPPRWRSFRSLYRVIFAIEEFVPSNRMPTKRHTRVFCIKYQAMAARAISYADMFAACSEARFQGNMPCALDVETCPPPRYERAAAIVAAILLTGDSVCISGMGISPYEKLELIDLVMAHLPYGLRAAMTTSTWDSDSTDRLQFRERPLLGGTRTHVVYWEERTKRITIPGWRPDADAEYYLRWFDSTRAPTAILAKLREPLCFDRRTARRVLQLVGATGH